MAMVLARQWVVLPIKQLSATNPRERIRPPRQRRLQAPTEALAPLNSMYVLSRKNSGFSTPAHPGFIEPVM